DGDTITTTVLTGADSCMSGVGNGCGTHNEASANFGPFDQAAFSVAEQEFTIKHSGARANATYYFRLIDATNGVTLLASSSYPSVNTEGARMQFTVDGLSSGTTTEGVVLDATSTATSIRIGSLPLNTEHEVAQRLVMDTNATEGFVIYMFTDQGLLSSSGEEISDISGSNESPVTWAAGCSAAGTSCFGYHVGDDTLSGGDTRFALDDTYAPVTNVPAEIMASAVPFIGTEDIVFRVEISEIQPAGQYETGVTYIAVPNF
ncbi:MAG: hypothetical protein AAFO91_01450, partial [Bacteroidota bacterium]